MKLDNNDLLNISGYTIWERVEIPVLDIIRKNYNFPNGSNVRREPGGNYLYSSGVSAYTNYMNGEYNPVFVRFTDKMENDRLVEVCITVVGEILNNTAELISKRYI